MKKYLFKVNFIMRAFILDTPYEQQGIKDVLVEADNYEKAQDIVYEGMKKAYCCFQVEDYSKEGRKIRRVYNALDNFSSALDELSEAWIELDEHNPTEEKLVNNLNGCFPKDMLNLSLGDFSVAIKDWKRKVQSNMKQKIIM